MEIFKLSMKKKITKNKFRIKEIVDGNNKSLFYPQYKSFFGTWEYFHNLIYGTKQSYDTLKEATYQLNRLKGRISKIIIHEVN